MGDDFKLVNSVGVVFDGTITDPGATEGDVLTVQSDGSIAAAAGGGSGSEYSYAFSDMPVSVPNGESAPLSWTSGTSPKLLDLTTPTAPAVTASGIYLVTVSVLPSAPITVTGLYTALLELDQSGADKRALATSPASLAAATQPAVVVTAAYYIPEGGIVTMTISNLDGASAVDFEMGDGSIILLG